MEEPAVYMCVPPYCGGGRGAPRWWDASARHSPGGFCRSWEPAAFSGKELPRLFGNVVPLIKILGEAK